MSLHRMTPRESFYPGMERLQGSPFMLRYNDSRGVVLSWDRTTPREALSPRIVILSWDRTTPGESFCPRI